MARDTLDLQPIESRDELIAWIAKGNKPESEFRIGTEHEKFPFYAKTLTPVPYEGQGQGQGHVNGIRALLEGMQARCGWEPIMEGDHPIGLVDPKSGGAISLEPGGQFELSGAPLETLHQTASELTAHFADLAAVAKPLGINFLLAGMSPLWSRAETPVMPKARYGIMSNYMPKVGTRGLDMMFRTSTVQVNLDFASEADMVAKFRVGLALQPLATALFSQSPFTEGKPNGRLSERSEIWRDTDNARAGMLPFVFEQGFGFERYVDYALNVPLYFVKRGDHYHDVSGARFHDLLAGKLKALPNEKAVISDWANHLTTIFPEVRLKRYLEMRGADCGPEAFLNALPAFWVGLLYHQPSLNAALDLIKPWSAEARQKLRDDVPVEGLHAKIQGRSLLEIGRDVLELAQQGLAARQQHNQLGQDETIYLAPLREVLASGLSGAARLLMLYKGEWQQDVRKIFAQPAYLMKN